MILIGLTGKVGSGKDTAAEGIIEHTRFEKCSFAAPLKMALNELFGWQMSDWDSLEWKETPNEACFGHTPRYVAQSFGTDWGRNMIDDGIWVNLAMRQALGHPRVVFTDVRFDNEAEAIRDFGGVIVEVVRIEDGAQTEHNEHSSEAGIDRGLIDVTVAALPGDIVYLKDGLEEIADAIIQGEYDHGSSTN